MAAIPAVEELVRCVSEGSIVSVLISSSRCLSAHCSQDSRDKNAAGFLGCVTLVVRTGSSRRCGLCIRCQYAQTHCRAVLLHTKRVALVRSQLKTVHESVRTPQSLHCLQIRCWTTSEMQHLNQSLKDSNKSVSVRDDMFTASASVTSKDSNGGRSRFQSNIRSSPWEVDPLQGAQTRYP
jgi:hypothetical protein